MMERIAILAGGGTLPTLLADSIVRRGGRAHIVAVRGEAGPQVETYPHTWVTWGAVNAILGTLKRESDGTMMIAGHVNRPDLRRLKPDFGVIRYLPKVLAMLKGGDDAVLTRLIRFFEGQGLTVKGVGDIAPELLATEGVLGWPAVTSNQTAADTALGFAVLDALADLDVGQAIVVERGQVLAIEGVEGTDRMLQRIAELDGRSPTLRPSADGVLVKGPKRGQDLRVDVPTVGAQTIGRLVDAHLKTLVIAAGKTLLLERGEMVRRAEVAQITIVATSRDEGAVAAGGARATRLGSLATYWAGPMLGRGAPNSPDAHDACTAAEVIQRLALFSTGRAAVVVRDHVLAIAAAEGPVGMAERIAPLRQWGGGRMVRAMGAAATLFDPAHDDPAGLVEMIDGLARGRIAGLAIVRAQGVDGTTAAAEIPAAAIAAADRAGLFLVDIAPAAAPHCPEAV